MKSLKQYITEGRMSASEYLEAKDKTKIKKLQKAIESFETKFIVDYALDVTYHYADSFWDKDTPMDGTYDLSVDVKRGEIVFDTAHETLSMEQGWINQQDDVVLIESGGGDESFVIRMIFDTVKDADAFMARLA